MAIKTPGSGRSNYMAPASTALPVAVELQNGTVAQELGHLYLHLQL